MKRLLQFLGLIFLGVLLYYGATYLANNYQKAIVGGLAVLGAITLTFVIVRLFYGKNWLLEFGKQFAIGSDLIKATENFLRELPKPSKGATANFTAHLVYRFTRLGLVALVLAIIPVWLLYQQNNKIDAQNELIKAQTKRLDQQTYLQEAERRSSLVFLFSNIMDAVDRELTTDIGEKGKRDLSPQLIGRIIALSTRLKPYRYLDGDTLIGKPLSPERGQLLVSLVESKLDSTTLSNIYSKANFGNADLERANLEEANLTGADLTGADLWGADLMKSCLIGTNLNEADLNEADLNEADLIGANLIGANLMGAYLMGANLTGAVLWEASLTGASLGGAYLTEAYLRGAYLTGADLKGADLTGADLKGADLKGADLTGADLKGADLRGADLRGADLRGADLSGADLSGADLNIAIVESDFFQKIQNYRKDSIIGTSHILSNYKIDTLIGWPRLVKTNPP